MNQVGSDSEQSKKHLFRSHESTWVFAQFTYICFCPMFHIFGQSHKCSMQCR